jgi:uncharacterized protein (TIGR01777 family)
MSIPKKVLIAGGTGLIGQELAHLLRTKGYTVRILTRGKSNPLKNLYHWNVKNKEIDEGALAGVQCIVNLVGAGIADKKWTNQRKEELISSRVEPAKFLAAILAENTSVKHYVSASGINCYGYDNDENVYKEDDEYGDDFLSSVVKKWENAADTMPGHVKVAKIRTSVVLTDKGGALPKIAKPIKMYAGAALGSGKQWMPWITNHDLCRLFEHVITNEIEGTYNALAAACTNQTFTKELAKTLKKPLWLPNVPAFVLKLFLGEMSSVVLDGLNASNEKIIKTGFDFEHKSLNDAFSAIYSA